MPLLEALKGLSPPKAGAGAPAPPKTNGDPPAAGGSDGAAGGPPKAKTLAPASGAGAEAPKLKEGVAEKEGAALGAVEAAPKAGAAEPKTDPVPKAGVEEFPNAGVDPKEGAADVGVPKEGNAEAAGASGFGAALKEKRPLLASGANFPASEAAAPPKPKTGALEKLNPPAAGAEGSSAFCPAENAKLGPPDFLAEDSPESSSFVLFIPRVAAGLTALAAKIDGVGVELFPNAKS